MAGTTGSASAYLDPKLFWKGYKESDTASDLCSYAETAPQVTMTETPMSFSDKKIMRTKFQGVINKLVRNPQLIMMTDGYVDEQLVCMSKKAQIVPGCWIEVTTLGRLDEAWCVTWLMSKMTFQQRDFERAKAWDEKAVTFFMCFALNATPQLVSLERVQEPGQ